MKRLTFPLAVTMLSLTFFDQLLAQNVGDSRTVAAGDWHSPIWQVYDGTNWNTVSAPAAGGRVDIYHDVTISSGTTGFLDGDDHIEGWLEIQSGGGLTLSGPNYNYIEGTVVDNGTLTNSGTLEVLGFPITTSNSTSLFTNSGTLDINSNGPGSLCRITANLVGGGAINVNTAAEIWGTISGGGPITIIESAGLRIGASGVLGDVTNHGTLQLTSTLELSNLMGGGIFQLLGTIIVNGTLNVQSGTIWLGGTKQGSGTLVFGAGTYSDLHLGFVAEGTLELHGDCSVSAMQNNGIVENYGTTTYVDGNLTGSGTFRNYSTFVLDRTPWPSLTTISQVFENHGTINKYETNGVNFEGTFNNYTGDTVNIYNGEIRLWATGTSTGTFNIASGKNLTIGGTYALESGASITGGGMVTLFANQLTVNTDVTFAVLKFDANNVVLTGTGARHVSSLLNWAGSCRNTGSGPLVIDNTATANVQGRANNGVIINYGTVDQTSPVFTDVTSGPNPICKNYGTWNMSFHSNEYLITQQDFENYGTLNLTNPIPCCEDLILVGEGSSYHFTNGVGGVLNVLAGSVRIANTPTIDGEVHVWSGAKLLGNGGINFIGTLFDNNGLVSSPVNFTTATEARKAPETTDKRIIDRGSADLADNLGLGTVDIKGRGVAVPVNFTTTTGRSLQDPGNKGSVTIGADYSDISVGKDTSEQRSGKITSTTQNLQGSGSINYLSMNGGNANLTSGHLVNNNLALTSGLVVLNDYSFTVGGVSGGSSASYVNTNGMGKLVRNVGTSDVSFPVGTSDSFNPVTVRTGTGTDTFAVGVAPGFATTAVQRVWSLSENITGGNGTITFSVQWTSGEQGSGFDRTLADGWRNDGTGWTLQTASLTSITPGTTYPAVATIASSSLSSWIVANHDTPLPIQLASFGGHETPGQGVQLDWTTLGEINNYGYFVQRKRSSDSSFVELANSFVPGHGTTNEPQTYSYRDSTVTAGTWLYRLKQVDLDGTVHLTYTIQVTVETTVSVKEPVREVAPLQFSLHQNYPNPFNPSTTIRFTVEKSDHATLEVYNILGQRVATLFDDIAESGLYHDVRFDASKIASGLYFYSLHSGKKNELRKLLLLK